MFVSVLSAMITNIFIVTIKTYRKFISPLKPPCCRFYPTCSEYAILSLKKFGFIKGSFRAILRILRCNPFFKGGYDPVD